MRGMTKMAFGSAMGLAMGIGLMMVPTMNRMIRRDVNKMKKWMKNM